MLLCRVGGAHCGLEEWVGGGGGAVLGEGEIEKRYRVTKRLEGRTPKNKNEGKEKSPSPF